MAPAMTKSPLALVRQALAAAQKALPQYSAVRSRKDFTQHQLFAILALRQFLHLDYRGVVQVLSEWSDLRQALKLKRVPHYTTLQKSHQRMLKKGLLRVF